MAKLSYYEKLKDPRWQRLRLEVMQDRHFCCEICGNDEETLNVHHKEYFKGREPWEYKIGQLACLCESCHETTHNGIDILKLISSYARLDGPENRTELAMLIAGFMDIDFFLITNVSDDYESKYLREIHKDGINARKAGYKRAQKRIDARNKEKSNEVV